MRQKISKLKFYLQSHIVSYRFIFSMIFLYVYFLSSYQFSCTRFLPFYTCTRKPLNHQICTSPHQYIPLIKKMNLKATARTQKQKYPQNLDNLEPYLGKIKLILYYTKLCPVGFTYSRAIRQITQITSSRTFLSV